MLTPQQVQLIKSGAPSGGANGGSSQTPMTPEQAKASFSSVPKQANGGSGLSSLFGLNISNPVSDIGNVANATSQGISKVKEGFQEGTDRNASPLQMIEGPVKSLAGAVDVASSPAAPALKPVGNIIQGTGEAISNIPAVQQFAGTSIGKATARGAEDVANLSEVAGAVGGSIKAPEAISTESSMTPPLETPKTSTPIASKINPVLQTAIKDATPSYSKSLIGEPSVKLPDGTIVPRVQEGGGVIKGRVVTPTSLETEAGTELSKVPGYDPKATNLEKYNAVQPELKARAQALTESLQGEKVLRPPKEIIKVVDTAVNGASKESLLLSKTDPVIKNYMRVVKNAVAANDGTLAGELKVRQALDAAYSNARGKMAFGSDRIAPLDELHSAARDALNQDIIDHAQSTDVKASLRSQWNLNRAAEVLRDKAEVEGNSTIDRLMKKYPITTKAVKSVGRYVGLHEVIKPLEP